MPHVHGRINGFDDDGSEAVIVIKVAKYAGFLRELGKSSCPNSLTTSIKPGSEFVDFGVHPGFVIVRLVLVSDLRDHTQQKSVSTFSAGGMTKIIFLR
jgi:hypothetical protein